MSAHQSKSPDTVALLTLLGQASELCRRLELPNDAATFDGFIVRFKKEPPTYDTLHGEVYHAINGVAALRIIAKLKDDYSDYRHLQLAFSEIAFPGNRETHKKIEKTKKERRSRKAIRDSETCWQLEGESDLYVGTLPDPPKSGAATTVRLTHSNSYGPIDEAEFFVRVGDSDKPTDQSDLDSASDWVKAHLIEEIVTVDDKEMLRSEARPESFEDEVPWEGTYDAELVIPAGRHSIEIKIVSQHPELLRSLVLTGWDVEVR
jgi:hypothetical protein